MITLSTVVTGFMLQGVILIGRDDFAFFVSLAYERLENRRDKCKMIGHCLANCRTSWNRAKESFKNPFLQSKTQYVPKRVRGDNGKAVKAVSMVEVTHEDGQRDKKNGYKGR